jgi:hypothetical protein
MTDLQINAAIAEACGWKLKKNYWLTPEGCEAFSWDIPDYCTDLNAMHEAEAYLIKNTTMMHYTNELYDLACKASKGKKIWNPYGATARQRAEAFLRTLGKWEEAE